MIELKIYSKEQIDSLIETKQDVLESQVNIKTINGEDILGEGNITLSIPQIIDNETYYTISY